MSGLENLKITVKEVVQIVLFVTTMAISFSTLNNKIDGILERMGNFQSFEKEVKIEDKEVFKENLLWRKSMEDRQNATTLQLKLIEQRIELIELHKIAN